MFLLVGTRNKLFTTLALLALVIGTSGLAADRHRGQDVTAPDLEDHANYFSKSRENASPELQKKADVLRQKTIASIKALLKKKANSKKVRRFELLLRLGELYVERHDYLRDLELRVYDQQYKNWEQNPANKRGKEPKLDHAASIGQMTRAANSFRQLVTEFPKHRRTDAALYSLGKTLARMGKATAVNYYQQLIKSFPKSRLIPDAYLALGEYYFEKHQIPQALANYKAVLKYKKHRAYPYAVYKLGWAYYNSSPKNDAEAKKNYRKAITAFKLVVKLSDRNKDKRSNNLDLRSEAIRDLIVVWAEAEDVNSAWAYFRKIGEKDSFYTMLERLGSIYTENGENKKAFTVYTRLLRESPNRPNNPSIAAKLVNLYDVLSDVDNAVASLKMMQKTYIGNGAWVVANSRDKQAVKEANETVEKNLHRYGALFHSRGQKAKNAKLMGSAATVYTYYLESYPNTKTAYEIRYYLAEILFDFKKYETAADNYIIVSRDKDNSKYRKSAALDAVVSMNTKVEATKFPKLPPAGQVSAPIPIPAVKKKLVGVIDNYVSLLPKEKDGHPMRFTAAQTYFDYGHYDDAMDRYGRLIQEIPGSKQSKSAVKIVLGYHADKSQWTKVIGWSNKFLTTKNLLDKKLNKFVVDMLRGSMFKQALALEKAKDYDGSAKAFLAYQKKFPKDENADRALYNAVVNFYRTSAIEDAIEVSNQMLKVYPRSKLAPNVVVQLSETYEGLAQFENAAKYYLTLAKSYPEDKRSPGAMFNAAVLYKGLSNQDLAARIFEDFVKMFPRDKLAAQASLELADIRYAQSRYKDAAKAYERYVIKYKTSGDQQLYAEARAAAIYSAHVDRRKGDRMLEALRKKLTTKGAPLAYEARRITAQAMFKSLEPKFAMFKALKITGGSKLEKEVSAKQQKLLELANGYETVITLGNVEHIVASFFRLGEAHENFAQALFSAPAPPGASQADLDRFRTELEKVAFPLKEEAYKFFETAYKRSTEVETFSPWTQRSYRKMVELAPEKHPVVNEMSAAAAYTTHEVKWDSALADLVTDE